MYKIVSCEFGQHKTAPQNPGKFIKLRMEDIVRITETHSCATPFPDTTELPAHLPLPLSVYCQQEAKSLSPINYHKKGENKMLREFKESRSCLHWGGQGT